MDRSSFRLGDIVLNFGMTAKVAEVLPHGLVLAGHGLGSHAGERWLADPAKCQRLDNQEGGMVHRSGLVALGGVA